MAFHLREANIQDAGAIAEVHVRTWQDAYKNQMPDDFLAALSVDQRKEKWRTILKTFKKQEKNFVAEMNGKIVGFASIGTCRDNDGKQNIGELYAIYIDPTHSGQGIGSALMKKSLEILREFGFQKAILWVLDSNDKAKKFYEKHGWISDGKKRTDTHHGIELLDVRYCIDL